MEEDESKKNIPADKSRSKTEECSDDLQSSNVSVSTTISDARITGESADMSSTVVEGAPTPAEGDIVPDVPMGSAQERPPKQDECSGSLQDSSLFKVPSVPDMIKFKAARAKSAPSSRMDVSAGQKSSDTSLFKIPSLPVRIKFRSARPKNAPSDEIDVSEGEKSYEFPSTSSSSEVYSPLDSDSVETSDTESPEEYSPTPCSSPDSSETSDTESVQASSSNPPPLEISSSLETDAVVRSDTGSSLDEFSSPPYSSRDTDTETSNTGQSSSTMYSSESDSVERSDTGLGPSLASSHSGSMIQFEGVTPPSWSLISPAPRPPPPLSRARLGHSIEESTSIPVLYRSQQTEVESSPSGSMVQFEEVSSISSAPRPSPPLPGARLGHSLEESTSVSGLYSSQQTEVESSHSGSMVQFEGVTPTSWSSISSAPRRSPVLSEASSLSDIPSLVSEEDLGGASSSTALSGERKRKSKSPTATNPPLKRSLSTGTELSQATLNQLLESEEAETEEPVSPLESVGQARVMGARPRYVPPPRRAASFDVPLEMEPNQPPEEVSDVETVASNPEEADEMEQS